MPLLEPVELETSGQRDSREGHWASLEALWEALSQVRRSCPSVGVEAIAWMQLKHPVHPVQWELMEAEGPSGQRLPHGWIVRLVRFWLCLLLAVREMGQLAMLRWRLRRVMGRLRAERFDWIAKSWVFGTGSSVGGNDFYYGNLQARLYSRGVHLFLLVADPMGWNLRLEAPSACWAPGAWRLPERCLVPLWAPFRMAWIQWKASGQLERLARQSQNPLVRRVADRAGWEVLSHQITPMGLYHWIGKEAARRWRPKAVLSLYEGRGWEHLWLNGAKGADPACRSVGYQHTILMPYNLELLRARGEGLPAQPDVVLCLGPRTKEWLTPSHPGSTVVTFGSFRKSPASVVSTGPRPEKGVVLVLPEAFLEEARWLFDAAMQAAAALPEYRFLLRCHPALPFRLVEESLQESPRAFPNIEASDRQSLDEDLARSSVALYRGSSSALYAIEQGLKIVYLRGTEAVSIDPLFDLQGWREVAEGPEDLIRILRGYLRSSGPSLQTPWRQAVEYVHRYMIPVEEPAIDRLLELVR